MVRKQYISITICTNCEKTIRVIKNLHSVIVKYDITVKKKSYKQKTGELHVARELHFAHRCFIHLAVTSVKFDCREDVCSIAHASLFFFPAFKRQRIPKIPQPCCIFSFVLLMFYCVDMQLLVTFVTFMRLSDMNSLYICSFRYSFLNQTTCDMWFCSRDRECSAISTCVCSNRHMVSATHYYRENIEKSKTKSR